jgi:hypothetical protein
MHVTEAACARQERANGHAVEAARQRLLAERERTVTLVRERVGWPVPAEVWTAAWREAAP